MGWRDREYARWTPEERRRHLGVSRRAGATQGAAAAAAVSAIVFALGHYPSGHPIVPALSFNLPSISRSSSYTPRIRQPAAPAQVQLRGPSVVRVGSFLTFRGPVPIGDNGQVTILGNLNDTAWRTLAVADGSNGTYVARITLDQRGVLKLRVVFRDGAEAVQTITVT